MDGVGADEDFIFSEYSVDDTLDPLQRLLRYYSSEFSLQRLVLIRDLVDTARFAEYADTAKQILPLLPTFAADPEPSVRQVFAAQLPALAAYLCECGDAGYEDFIQHVLPSVVELLVDKNVEVGYAALKGLGQLAVHVRPPQVEAQLLRCVTSLARDERAEDYRVVAAQLFDDLSDKFGADLCLSKVLPEVRALSKDSSFSVRRAVASSLGGLCAVLGQTQAEAHVLPIFLALCKDDIWSVRKACAEAIVRVSEGVTPAARVGQLVPALKALSQDQTRWVRVSAFQYLGQFLHTLRRDDVSTLLLKDFTSMAFQGEGGDSDFAEYCAYSFPAVVQALGAERWRELDDAFATLVRDVQWKVRRTIACSLHEFARVLGPEITERALTPALEALLKDLDEIKLAVLPQVDQFLAVLPPAGRERLLPLVCAVPPDSENWRLRQLVASKLGVLAPLVSPQCAFDAMGDLVIHLLEDTVAEVRLSTYHAAAALLQHLDGTEYHDRFFECIAALATKPTYVWRQMFLYIAQQAAELGPDAAKTTEKMLNLMPALASDPVDNVRFVCARVLASSFCNNPQWKSHPKVVALVRTLAADKDADVAAMVQMHLPRVEDVPRAAAYRPNV
jgi:serine/threonine-protein phosphatase 4 regulatory subunit 1